MSKTHFRKIKDPNFLGSWDLMLENGSYGKLVLTIEKAGTQEVVDHKGQKTSEAVVNFKGYKPMILNHTNVRAIVKATGSPYIEDWAGKPVTLYVKKVKAFGEMHDALRIEPLAPKQIVKAKPKLNDERFANAIEGLKNGTVKIETIKGYDLTNEQLKTIAEWKN